MMENGLADSRACALLKEYFGQGMFIVGYVLHAKSVIHLGHRSGSGGFSMSQATHTMPTPSYSELLE